MSYPVYYNGEITISPETDPDRATLLDEALRTNHLERLGITAEDGRDLYHGCDWRYRDGCLSIEGESRDGQEAWLRLLDTRFFQPNGFALSGEVSWDGDQSGDTGVIYVEEHRIEAVADTTTNRGPGWRRQLPDPSVVDLVRAGRGVLTRWESGDLAAAVRTLADALQAFAEVPIVNGGHYLCSVIFAVRPSHAGGSKPSRSLLSVEMS